MRVHNSSVWGAHKHTLTRVLAIAAAHEIDGIRPSASSIWQMNAKRAYHADELVRSQRNNKINRRMRTHHFSVWHEFIYTVFGIRSISHIPFHPIPLIRGSFSHAAAVEHIKYFAHHSFRNWQCRSPQNQRFLGNFEIRIESTSSLHMCRRKVVLFSKWIPSEKLTTENRWAKNGVSLYFEFHLVSGFIKSSSNSYGTIYRRSRPDSWTF